MQDGGGVGKEHQNEPAHSGIEKLIADDLVCIRLNETDIVDSCLRDALAGPGDGRRVPLNAHHFPGRTDDPRQEHGYVAHARAEIEDALARTNAGVAE